MEVTSLSSCAIDKMADNEDKSVNNNCQRSLTELPDEIIEEILIDNNLDAQDLLNFCLSCRRFGNIFRSTKVWKSKFYQRWPSTQKNISSHDWATKYKKHLCLCRDIKTVISKMSPTYFHCDEISDEDYAEMFSSLIETFTGDTILSVLMDLIERNKDLTWAYYSQKVLGFLRHSILEKSWQTLLAGPHDLEHGAILLADWCQPAQQSCKEYVLKELESIHQMVHDSLPQHIRSSIASKDLNPEKERTILQSLNRVLFEDLKYNGNTDNYYDEENSYIDKVLQNRKGIPITMCIIYSALARRLGVFCDVINLPFHLVLRWKEHPYASGENQFTYIDSFDGGKFLAFENLNSLLMGYFVNAEFVQPVSNVEVYRRMCRNLSRDENPSDKLGLKEILDLALLLSPSSNEILIYHAKVNLFLGINAKKVKESLDKVIQSGRMGYGLERLISVANELEEKYKRMKNKEIVPKRRNEGENKMVEFSTGMIMKHKRYHYDCVIYGWDYTCKQGDQWIQQMGVNNLPHGQYQPFYSVLVADGSLRYAAQENLELHASPQMITHPLVGKYFEAFGGSYYSGNNEMKTKYPDDLEVTISLSSKRSPNEK